MLGPPNSSPLFTAFHEALVLLFLLFQRAPQRRVAGEALTDVTKGWFSELLNYFFFYPKSGASK